MANVSAFTGAMPVIPGGTVELGYSAVTTASISISSSSPGTGATSIVPPMTVVCDGGPVEIRCFLPQVVAGATTGSAVFISLLKDGAEFVRYWAVVAQANVNAPVLLTYRDAPTSGSHTYEVRAYNYLSNGIVYAGNGTTTQAPITLTVSKIVNQNDGLKPFWTPPVVTQLPSQATVGDQVLRLTGSTYQPFQYVDSVTGWKYVGNDSGVLYNRLSDSGSVTTSETQVGSVTVGANFFQPGDIIRGTIIGTRTGTTTSTWTGRMRIGTTTLTGTIVAGATSAASAIAGTGFAQFNVVVRSIGASGSFSGYASVGQPTSTGAPSYSATTVNTTAGNIIELTASTSANSYVFNQVIVERIRNL